MGIAYNPRTVTDGLVLCLDVGNNKSVPKNNILGTWTDYGGNQANYEILGTYSVKLKNTTTAWVGRFPATISSTGKYVITFTYYSDSNGSTLILDNDGIMDNTYNTTLTANIAPQTYTGSVDVTTTGDILHYFRRNGGGNIFVTDVSYFKLETTWTDLSGNGNNGTLVNGVGYNSSNGGSLSFDGTNDYITVSNVQPNTNNFTISVWVYKFNTTSNDYIWDFGENGGTLSSGTDISGYGFRYYNSTLGSSSNMYTQGTVPEINKWYNVVVVRNSGTSSMYVNGSFITSSSGDTHNISSTTLTIGDHGGSGTYSHHGYISNFSIYNKALTPQEIQQNYNATKSRFQ